MHQYFLDHNLRYKVLISKIKIKRRVKNNFQYSREKNGIKKYKAKIKIVKTTHKYL